MKRLPFYIDARSSWGDARAARLQTLHGEFFTPMFMPVGTQATVKSLRPEDLKTAGSQMLLANTYHLLLRPGVEVFEKFGGIHRFMNWDGGVLTDSGGFQIFSLPHARRMTEDGAHFKSYVDGRIICLTPERSIEVQKAIGSDIMMVLDECVPSTSGHAEAHRAMELTHRWALRSLTARGDSQQALFAIVQGACHSDLRKQSSDFLTQHEFDGFAIGGLAVGETKNQREEFTGLVAGFLPRERPRYLMGVGTPLDLLEAVHRGVDMFDCIIPTALAQQGSVFTSQGRKKVTRGVYKFKEDPLDRECPCSTCQKYSIAYLHHLIKSDEVLGWHLLSVHNVTFYHRLMKSMRTAILEDSWRSFYESQRTQLALSDEDHPSVLPRKNKKTKNQKLGDYEVLGQKNFWSIRHIPSGEIMHSVNNPDEEAKNLYVSQVENSLMVGPADQPWVIWDVGLGAAHNAMAWIRQYESRVAEGTEALRPLWLVSFEIDLDPLRLVLKNPSQFHHVRHPAPYELMKAGVWKTESLTWDLRGDFVAEMPQAPAPDLIIFDPFSSKTAGDLWTQTIFDRIAEVAKKSKKAPILITYSQAKGFRERLSKSGFQVSPGIRTGPKEETTIARWPGDS